MLDCYILAGGKSRRFGQDKTVFPIFGKPMIQHAVERAKLVCDSLYIVCKDTNKYAFVEGVKTVKDEEEEQFALAGVYTALKATNSEKVLILSADMPFLKPKALLHLIERSEHPITVFKVERKIYPFPGVYYRDLHTQLLTYILKGGRKVTDFLINVGTKFIGMEREDTLSFLNVNTQEDIELIRRCCMERTLLVKGMTCQHCVQSIKRALLELEGISHVDVDLNRGEVKVFLEKDVPFESMRESIERWGYSVIGEV